MRLLERALASWMGGSTLRELELLIAGTRRSSTMCERARQFALNVTRDLAYLAALPARLAARGIVSVDEDTARDCLDRCVRGGFDSVDLLALAELDLSDGGGRRAAHLEYAQLWEYLPEVTPTGSFDDARLRVQLARLERAAVDFDAL